jgi:MFS family permease
VRSYVRSLNPRLPRSVQVLQLGGLLNSLGNGLVLPFTFIYLHNVHGFSLALAGLILGTNAGVSLLSGPVAGAFVDRIGGKRMLALSLVFLTAGFALYPFIELPWHGFLASSLVGIGTGMFYPAQAALIAGLTPAHKRPAAYAMQRVVVNLGLGLGGVAAGFIASTDAPGTFTVLFVANAASFVGYAFILWAFVPQPPRRARAAGARPGRYTDVLRHRVFMAFTAVNALFIAAGFAVLELIAVYGKNEAGLHERGIGFLYLCNTLVIVLAQLPVTRLSEGRRRMRTLALLGVVWAVAWLLVPISGLWLDPGAALALLIVVVVIVGIGECLHGAVQPSLVADLADHSMLGRYMAISSFSWQLGFTIGPVAGGILLGLTPTGTWLVAAAACLVAGAASLALERGLPAGVRRTPLHEPAVPPPVAVPAAAGLDRLSAAE